MKGKTVILPLAALLAAGALYWAAEAIKQVASAQPGLEIRLYSAVWGELQASGALGEEKPLGDWKTAALKTAPDAGRKPLSTIHLLSPSKGRMRVAERVRDRNWFHAYALEHRLIQVTAVFETLSLDFLAHWKKSPEGESLRFAPLLSYDTGTFAESVETKDLGADIPLNGPKGCLAMTSGEPLLKRILQDSGAAGADAVILCWSR